MQRLTAESVTLGYDQRIIAEDLSVEIPDNSFTVIVGPTPAASRRCCARSPGC